MDQRLVPEEVAMRLIDEALKNGARLFRACAELGLCPRTYRRWTVLDGAVKADGRPVADRPLAANALSEDERQKLIVLSCQPEFASLPPSQIVPILADRGEYYASESSFYRVLRAAGQLARRGKARAPTRQRPAPLQATAPNQLWSWDITYLANTLKGSFFYLYLIMDVCSRKSVGWEVFAQASAEQAAAVFTAARLKDGDAEVTRRLFHTLRGASVNVDASRMAELAGRAEIAAESSDLAEAGGLLPRLVEAREEFVAEVDSAHDQVGSPRGADCIIDAQETGGGGAYENTCGGG